MKNVLIIYNMNSADAIASAAIIYNSQEPLSNHCDAIGIKESWNGIIDTIDKTPYANEYMSLTAKRTYSSLSHYNIYIVGFDYDINFIKRVMIQRIRTHWIFIFKLPTSEYSTTIKSLKSEFKLKGLQTNSQSTTYYNDRMTVYTSKNHSITWFTYKRELDFDRKPITIRYIEDYVTGKNRFENSKLFVSYILKNLWDANELEWKEMLIGRYYKGKYVFDPKSIDRINTYLKTVAQEDKENEALEG